MDEPPALGPRPGTPAADACTAAEEGVSDYGWQGDEPSRTCAGCGERVTLYAEPVWFQRYPIVRTWHARCRPRSAS